MKAFLILEDGSCFTGRSIGKREEVISEIVFNTSMSGYQEVLTDPSYAGQAVAMTYPLIGNYGICGEDMQREKVHADGFIVRDLSRLASNWRAENTLQNFLVTEGVSGIAGIDTRALTRKLRDHGTMNGCITTSVYEGEAREELLRRIREYRVTGVVRRTSTSEIIHYPGVPGYPGRKKVALLDVGSKKEIVRCLQRQGCDINAYPASTKAEAILDWNPDGIVISNGPGDPKENVSVIREIRKLADSGIPVFAVCLGHQLIALAMGGDTYKMKFGHRGANHPVKDLETGRVYITSQNHGYAVREDSLPPGEAEPAFRNLNDGTNEGFRYKGRDILTVQFHPEAGPGPLDCGYLFEDFRKVMERRAQSKAQGG